MKHQRSIIYYKLYIHWSRFLQTSSNFTSLFPLLILKNSFLVSVNSFLLSLFRQADEKVFVLAKRNSFFLKTTKLSFCSEYTTNCLFSGLENMLSKLETTMQCICSWIQGRRVNEMYFSMQPWTPRAGVRKGSNRGSCLNVATLSSTFRYE